MIEPLSLTGSDHLDLRHSSAQGASKTLKGFFLSSKNDNNKTPGENLIKNPCLVPTQKNKNKGIVQMQC